MNNETIFSPRSPHIHRLSFNHQEKKELMDKIQEEHKFKTLTGFHKIQSPRRAPAKNSFNVPQHAAKRDKNCCVIL